MANYSRCGIDCNNCKYKTEMNCAGCKEIQGNVFWGKCDLYACIEKKNIEHCGKCNSFPCKMIKEWASKENPERIKNLYSIK
ncbi:MAG: DUF3795 domain-containing protein [Ruminococcus sp.]|nr:DUF3795 domain-containing protein [Ruminococcus sp.]